MKKKNKQKKTNSSQFLTRIASHPRNKNEKMKKKIRAVANEMLWVTLHGTS